jgi:hypothetical protein
MEYHCEIINTGWSKTNDKAMVGELDFVVDGVQRRTYQVPLITKPGWGARPDERAMAEMAVRTHASRYDICYPMTVTVTRCDTGEQWRVTVSPAMTYDVRVEND